MSRFHHNIVVLVHQFDMKTPIEQFDLETAKDCLERISLNFNHLDNANENLFSYDAANGDNFKGLFYTVNSLNIILCNHKSG